jgi:hypothetical protein
LSKKNKTRVHGCGLAPMCYLPSAFALRIVLSLLFGAVFGSPPKEFPTFVWNRTRLVCCFTEFFSSWGACRK